jgi:hypothetical protein
MPPLALDDDQLADLMRLAGPIPIEHRDDFLKAVAAALRDTEPGAGALHRAARALQRRFTTAPPTANTAGFRSKYR